MPAGGLGVTPGVRTLLVTGAGGAGRTTVAAATALAAARAGLRVLLLTTDRLGTLETALGVAGTGGGPAEPPRAAAAVTAPWTRPAEAAPGLWAARIDADADFRTRLLTLQERSAAALNLLGADPLDAEEITELPGAPQLAFLSALTALREALPASHGEDLGRADTAAESGWDLAVVDMPPVPEALALLAMPEHARRYLRRLLPPERQAARALRPVLAQLAGVPMPAQWLYETAARCERELAAAQALLDSAGTRVRLVVEPGPAAADALRRARAGLALYGLRTDAVIANRLLPTGSTDPWLTAASGRQQAALKDLHAGTGPGPGPGPDEAATAVCELPHLGRDPRGLDDLALLAERSVLAGPPADASRTAGPTSGSADPAAGEGDDDPAGAPPARGGHTTWPVEDRLDSDGVLVWRLTLPGARREDIDLARRGGELLLAVGPFRRILLLPSALRRCTVSGAALVDGELRVRFTPDPALWPRPSTARSATSRPSTSHTSPPDPSAPGADAVPGT